MTETTLKKIEVTNFGVFKGHHTFRLDVPGLTLVTGENLDASTTSSNGSGKTTVFKAVSWALFGRTVDGLSTNVVTTGYSRVEVKLMFLVDGVGHTVTRSRTKSSSSLLLWSGGFDLTQNNKARTQQSIEDLIGVDFCGFRCCALFGQGDTARFASPTMTDAERKRILTGLLDLEKYDRARTHAKKEVMRYRETVNEVSEKVYKLGGEISRDEAKLARFKGEEAVLLEILTDGAARQDKLCEIIALSKNTTKRLQRNLSPLPSLLDDLRGELAEVQKLQALALKTMQVTGATIKSERAFVSAVSAGGDCPTCRQSLDDVGTESAKGREAKALARRKSLKVQTGELSEEGDDLEGEIRQTQRSIRELESELVLEEAKRQSKAEDHEDLELRISSVQTNLSDLEQSVVKTELKIDKAKQKILAEQVIAKALNLELSAWDWWSRTGFGSKGVPAYAIEQALPALNCATNTHLSVLSGGDLSVCWTATTPGGKGKDKEQLTCNMVIDGVEGHAPSGGQLKKIELATELALAEIVADSGQATFDFIFFDEAFDGLDATARGHVVEWLATLPHTTVLVVSHTDEIADRFENRIHVVKQGGGATAELTT